MRTASLLIAGVLSVLLAAAGVLLGPAPAPSSAVSGTPVKDVSTRFSPSRHGFTFINHPGADHGVLAAVFSGLCGGMSYAALDYYWAGRAPSATEVDRYLMLRDVQSLVANAGSFVRWTVAPDTPARPGGFGVATSTRASEIPDLVRRLHDGPVALGLVKARDLGHIGRNHQVVAYALEREDGRVRVRIYDPNHVQSDDTSLLLDLSGHAAVTEECDGEAVDSWRGFFVENYAPARPPGP